MNDNLLKLPSRQRTALRPELKELRALRESHKTMTLEQLQRIAMVELAKFHETLDRLTWGLDRE